MSYFHALKLTKFEPVGFTAIAIQSGMPIRHCYERVNQLIKARWTKQNLMLMFSTFQMQSTSAAEWRVPQEDKKDYVVNKTTLFHLHKLQNFKSTKIPVNFNKSAIYLLYFTFVVTRTWN